MKHILQKTAQLFFISVLVISGAKVNGQTITTVVGNGTQGSSGDGGQATSAELNGPSSLVFDNASNMYISLVYGNTVRKVTPSGIISTIAGTGLTGFAGDGGLATKASLSAPTGIAVDDSGNVYIADNQNNRIRKVSASTGNITTIAGKGKAGFTGDGGPADSAELNEPYDIAIDNSGNIYFSDYGNFRIRKISGGTISTVAGTSTSGFSGDGGPASLAQLAGPEGIAVDDSGNVYVADLSNQRIRKIDITSGKITTVAGDGVGAFAGDGGLATTAEINKPTGVAIDSAGDIFICDQGNQRIRKVTGGIINTIGGNGSRGYTGDGGPATLAELNNPNNVAVDTGGNIYVADLYNNVIRQITACKSSVTINPTTPTICGGQGVVLVASGGTNYSWSPSTGLSATTGDSVIANPSVTVTYTITSSGSGCGTTGTDVVTVLPAPNQPTITVSETGDSLISSATTGNQWYFNDTLLTDSTRQVLVIKGLPKGWYFVQVTNPANGCNSRSDSTTGIYDITLLNNLKVFPNPFNNNLVVQINTSSDLNGWLMQLTDVLGRVVYTEPDVRYNNTIDLSKLPDGVYFISITTKNGKASLPVIKQE